MAHVKNVLVSEVKSSYDPMTHFLTHGLTIKSVYKTYNICKLCNATSGNQSQHLLWSVTFLQIPLSFAVGQNESIITLAFFFPSKNLLSSETYGNARVDIHSFFKFKLK